jgi:hypothetical protein
LTKLGFVRKFRPKRFRKIGPSADSAYETNVIHVISGLWDPRETSLAVLNKETPPEVPFVYLTIAADLVKA